MEESAGIFKSSGDFINKTAKTISCWLCLANVVFKLELLRCCRRLLLIIYCTSEGGDVQYQNKKQQVMHNIGMVVEKA